MPQVRGAHALAGAKLPKAGDLGSTHRRCIVRSRYSASGGARSVATYVGKADAPEREAGAEKVVGYVGRGSSKEPFFDANNNRIGREEVTRELQAGARVWHLKLNPLDGGNRELDLRLFTRDFMATVQDDVGREIRWYAAIHRSDRFDRDGAAHVHVVFSSKAMDTNRDFRFAKQYVKDGFLLRASEAVEGQLGRMAPHEMARLREQLEDNRERHVTLQQLERAHTPIGQRIAAGRAWTRQPTLRKERQAEQVNGAPTKAPPTQRERDEAAGAAALRKHLASERRDDSATPRPLSATGEKWVTYFAIVENAPGVVRGQKRNLVAMVKDPGVSAERMTERAGDFFRAQGLRERLPRISPKTALTLGKLSKLTPVKLRSLERHVATKLHDLAERKVFEAEARTYRPKAQQQMARGQGSDAMFARLERGQQVLRSGARSLAAGAAHTAERIVRDFDRSLAPNLYRAPPVRER